ncbi:MAG: hypothetical protein WC169_12375 [Dehalococcoidia bacterium]|jgi:hypothetical protein
MNKAIEIAKYIGQPIDSNLPVSPILAEIADLETAEVGENVYTVVPDDGNGVDTIYTTDSNGTIVSVKVTLGTSTELTFAFLQSKLEYVLVKEVLGSPDKTALARRKASIVRSMDKIEVKRCLDAILAVSSQEVEQSTGGDILDLIKALARKVENYGDNMILLCGTTCWNAINDYSKTKVEDNNYELDIDKEIKKLGIEKRMKVIGNIKLDSGSDLAVLDASKMILVARDSSLLKGKPIVFVRRKMSPIAENAGAEITAEERALFVPEVPAPFYNGTTMATGYGVFGFESVIHAVLNYRAVSFATYDASLDV